MADEQEPQFIVFSDKPNLELLWQCCLIAEEDVSVKAVMDRSRPNSRPSFNFIRKRLARRDCAIRNLHRPFREMALQCRIDPKLVVATSAHVPEKFARCVQCVAAQKN